MKMRVQKRSRGRHAVFAVIALGLMLVTGGGALSLVSEVLASSLQVQAIEPTCEEPNWDLTVTPTGEFLGYREIEFDQVTLDTGGGPDPILPDYTPWVTTAANALTVLSQQGSGEAHFDGRIHVHTGSFIDGTPVNNVPADGTDPFQIHASVAGAFSDWSPGMVGRLGNELFLVLDVINDNSTLSVDREHAGTVAETGSSVSRWDRGNEANDSPLELSSYFNFSAGDCGGNLVIHKLVDSGNGYESVGSGNQPFTFVASVNGQPVDSGVQDELLTVPTSETVDVTEEEQAGFQFDGFAFAPGGECPVDGPEPGSISITPDDWPIGGEDEEGQPVVLHLCAYNTLLEAERTITLWKVTSSAGFQQTDFGGFVTSTLSGATNDFTLTLPQHLSGSGILVGSQNPLGVDVGPQTVEEVDLPAGWTLDGVRYSSTNEDCNQVLGPDFADAPGGQLPGGEEDLTVCVINQFQAPTADQLTIRKDNGSGVAVGGATFRIQGEGQDYCVTDNDAVDPSTVPGCETAQALSDQNGAAGATLIDGLTGGDWTVQEVRAPDGYGNDTCGGGRSFNNEGATEPTVLQGAGCAGTMTAFHNPQLSAFKVHVRKGILGANGRVAANSSNAEGQSFNLLRSYANEDNDVVDEEYTLGPTGYSSLTPALEDAASFSTTELLDSVCTAGDPEDRFRLVGYSVGATLSEALNTAEILEIGTLSLTDVDSNTYVVVWNAPCKARFVVIKTYQGAAATAENAPLIFNSLEAGEGDQGSHVGGPSSWDMHVTVNGPAEAIVGEVLPDPEDWEVVAATWGASMATCGANEGTIDDVNSQFDASVTVPEVVQGGTYYVCFTNRAVGTVRLVKSTNLAIEQQQWGFAFSPAGGTMDADEALETAGGALGVNRSADTQFVGVPAGNYTVAEGNGGVCGGGPDDMRTVALAAVGAIPDPDVDDVVGSGILNFTVVKGETTTIVFENQSCLLGDIDVATIVVNKHRDLEGAFASDGPIEGWEVTITGTAGAATGHTETQLTGPDGSAFFVDVPPGTYTVSETPQAEYNVIGSVLNGDLDPGALDADASRVGIDVNTGDVDVIDFYNQPKPRLLIKKVNLGGPISDEFTADIGGPGFDDIPFSAQTAGSVYLPVPGDYLVTEDAAPDYAYAGWAAVEGNSACPNIPDSNEVTALAPMAAGEVTTVCFYNRALGSITVTKVTLTNGLLDTGENGGWQITVSSVACNIFRQGLTVDPSGEVTFTDLPACADYVVSENTNKVPFVNPGLLFTAQGATSVSGVAVTLGGDAAVTFTNVRGTGAQGTTPPPPPPPSGNTGGNTNATPTSTTGGASPTAVSTVAGAKTAVATPGAPSAGNGRFATAQGSLGLYLAGFGMLLLAGGMACLVPSSRRLR